MALHDVLLDKQVSRDHVQAIHNPDSIVAFFAYLGYHTDARIAQTPANLGITADSLVRSIRNVELIAEQEGLLQVYLFELSSVTVAATQGIARAFRGLAGQFLLVLTSDYSRLDFVLLERVLPQKERGKGEDPFRRRQVGVQPRILSVDRRNPDERHVRVLRRLTYTESDPYYQYDKLRSAYDAAYWSEEHFDNRALFSDYYLLHRLPEMPEWKEDPTSAYRKLRDLYANARTQWAGKPEAELRDGVLLPALDILGFKWTQKKSAESDATEPDYHLLAPGDGLLLADCVVYPWARSLDGPDDQRDKETQDENPTAVAVSLLERGDANWAVVTNGKQWRLYARRAHNKATNTYEIDLEEVLARDDPHHAFRYFWLIFRRQAFEPVPFEAAEEGAEPKPVCFLDRLFDGSQDYAKRLGERLKDRVFMQVFPHFAEGFVERICQERGIKRSDLAQEELDAVFQGTLTLLYRLLFLLYAESRDLLPVKEFHGYFQRSLDRLKKEIADALGAEAYAVPGSVKRAYRTDSYELYDRVAELFRVIDRGDPSLNVPIYNGGLFLTDVPDHDTSPEAANARFLLAHRVPDRQLALGLDLMARDEDDKTLKLVYIDYKSLGVRQLGSIYEGLLEFKLRVAGERLAVIKVKGKEVYKPTRQLTDAERTRWERALTRAKNKADLFGPAAANVAVSRNQVYLENDKRERKATGSYYTPDHIVKYIVGHAVGPVLDEKFKAVRPALRKAQKKRDEFFKPQKGLEDSGLKKEPASKADLIGREVVDQLFDIKVLDPAMGSGHFLVEAVDFITDKMLVFLRAFSWNPVVAFLRETKRTILQQMEDQGITIDDRRLTDVNLLKRHILKRCVYGVDLNPMAVELAKVSLWLDCFTLGAPLSFLQHHMKRGNSLIGVTVEGVQTALKEADRYTKTEMYAGSLFGTPFTGLMLATDMMRQIGGMPDITSAQVHESRAAYRRASDALWPFKRILDLYTSRWFGNEPTETGRGNKKQVEDHAVDFLNSPEAKDFLEAVQHEAEQRALPPDHPRVIQAALKKLGPNDCKLVETTLHAADDKSFFHWELEFPEVFYGPREGSSQAIERLERGGFDAVIGNPPYLSFSGRQAAKGNEELLVIQDWLGVREGWTSRHGLFMIQATRIAKPAGRISMIVPAQVGHLEGYASTRANVLAACRLAEVRYWGEDVFEEATTPSLTFAAVKTSPSAVKVTPAVVVLRDGSSYEFEPTGRDEWYTSRARCVYEAVSARHETLLTFSDPGVHTGNVSKKLILRECAERCVPILEGRQIHPFHCDAPAAWLNLGYSPKQGEYFRIAPTETFRQTDIVLRQTADRPIAARHIHKCHFRNSVLALRVPEEFSIEYLLGLLNSQALAWLYQVSVAESGQRAFPQVKVTALRRIPIPHPRESPSLTSEIEALVRCVEARGASSGAHTNEKALLDEIVARLYGLESEVLTGGGR